MPCEETIMLKGPGDIEAGGKNRGVYDAAGDKDNDSHPLKRDKQLDKQNLQKELSKSFFKYDDELLRRTVADAGRWAFGTVLVELWALNENQTFLTRPTAGWWVDPMYHRECGDDCQICRLTNKERSDYVPPESLSPGEGLPGVLWMETSGAGASVASSSRLLFGSQQYNSRRRLRKLPDQVFSDAVNTQKRVVWREVQAIANDPDQPWNPRLQLMASLGLGWVAAVEFNLHGHSGMMVFIARQGVDLNRLQSESNEAYLIAASDLAGAAFALRGPRRKVVHERRSELSNVLRRVRDKILALRRLGIDLEEFINENAARQEEIAAQRPTLDSQVAEFFKSTQERLVRTMIKTRGAGVLSPPAMSWKQTLLTFVGVFATLLMVTRMNIYVVEVHGLDYAIVLGPFGALMTLLYGLTAAPASQPRNAILGQTISMTIAIGVGYADEMEIWMRQSLATALAVACMVKLGLTHPPAGASALIYASGSFRWGNMLFMLIGNVIALGTATLINNWSNKRQYPSCWGIPPLDSYVGTMKAKEAKKIA